MSFDSLETSIADGKPVRLYLFERGLLKWAYNSSNRDITYEGVLYAGVAISDDGIRQRGVVSADVLKITAQHDLPVAQQFKVVAPSAEIALTIFDLHYSDLLARVRWSGSIAGVNWPSPESCEIRCESLSASMEKTGLRMTYGRPCPYTLYDHRCKASKEARRVTALVSGLTGISISSGIFGAVPAGYFSGGFVEWEIGQGELERRGIERHEGTTLTMLELTHGLSLGMEVHAYPGCDRLIATCDARFNNRLNYGGVPGMPGKSPFSNEPLF